MNAQKKVHVRRLTGSASLMVLLLAMVNTLPGQTKLNQQARQLLAERKLQPITYPFTFAVISDLHVGCVGENQCWAPQTNCVGNIFLPDLLSNIETLPVRPEFVVACGDLTEWGWHEQYRFYHDTIAAWMNGTKIPVFSLPGNHDFYPFCFLPPGGHQNYRDWIDNVQYFDNTYDYYDYYFDFGNSRFIMIDDVQKNDSWNWANDAKFTSTQHTWMEAWLQTAPSGRFTFAHISPRLSYSGYADLQNLTESYNVRASFYGHEHDYAHEDVGCLYDQFRVPSNKDAPRGWLSVSVDQTLGACGLSVNWHSNPVSTWTTSRVYPEPSVNLPGQTVRSCKVYVADEISAGDVGSPYVVDGPVTVKFVSPNGIVMKKGLLQVRNGGTIQIGDPQCRR
jgi:hypothetical protein